MMLQNTFQCDNADIFGTVQDVILYVRLKNILG